ncbi:glycosyltransferase [Bowmanella sp. JS7-9]|uniref:Glycosyltransferase n=1 Tax=Pseudobowmanella zhangzhouensis TaxID=1537679 RepID=A0ABW1XFF3_9ALTE|nr:glycosyltransferase [Bowmanella sp. JS7-9]TBX20816.1 glycosyltransferase [Bowmanella sp. JS7-9]
MKLLVIGYVWPEPNSSAAGSRMLDLIRGFQGRGWQVDFASAAELSPHRFKLSDIGVTEHNIALNCSSFDAFVEALQPDAVMFDRFMLEEQFGWRVANSCPNALRILDLEDLHFLRNARHDAVKQGIDPFNADLQTDMAIREIAAIYRCDITLVTSPAEMDILTGHFGVPEQLLCYAPLTANVPDTSPIVEFSERQHLVSIGNFRHAPNWDAVLELKRLWPQIRKHLPEAELHIYGAYPPKKATQLHNPQQGFMVKGWADDAFTVIRQARMLVAPLRFGAGQKGKLLDAMVCATPSVTTAIGAEGMQGQTDWPGAVATSEEDFIQQVVRLYQHESDWQLASQRCLAHLQALFEPTTHQQRIMTTIHHLLVTLPQHRRANFTGRMLQHNTMHASRYMTQWIEAKNK